MLPYLYAVAFFLFCVGADILWFQDLKKFYDYYRKLALGAARTCCAARPCYPGKKLNFHDSILESHEINDFKWCSYKLAVPWLLGVKIVLKAVSFRGLLTFVLWTKQTSHVTPPPTPPPDPPEEDRVIAVTSGGVGLLFIADTDCICGNLPVGLSNKMWVRMYQRAQGQAPGSVQYMLATETSVNN
ncbi:hypothetical protein H5410_026341 [Solanum commersonii]|uniref:Uncharacterized protein n=1 Tax=Solanum commersonii TaxID=4109 RepID=A0A9J5YW98_SOLCO|nr:hypothetical protein H5410_026341 [Solanum commersonii]